MKVANQEQVTLTIALNIKTLIQIYLNQLLYKNQIFLMTNNLKRKNASNS